MSQRGWQVTVIGPRERFGTASHAAIGVSSLKGHILPSQALFLAKLKGHEQLPHWLAKIEQDSGQFIPQIKSGVVEPFFDRAGFSYLSERVFHGKFRGCLRARLMAPNELAESSLHVPFLQKSPRGAFYYPGDLWFDPVQTLQALEQAILRLNGTIIDDTVHRVSPGVSGEMQVICTEGVYRAKEALLAAGAFSNDILGESGLPTLPLQLSPGETLYAQTDAELSINLRLGKTNYVGHNRQLRWGSTSRTANSLQKELALGPSAGGIETLWDEASRLTKPDFLFRDRMSLKWGIRTRVRDRAPVVGPLFWPNQGQEKLWVAVGFYKNGLQLAGYLARYLADSLCGIPSGHQDQQIWRLIAPSRLVG